MLAWDVQQNLPPKSWRACRCATAQVVCCLPWAVVKVMQSCRGQRNSMPHHSALEKACTCISYGRSQWT
eukprot:symbB.v1.2.023443.t1/scaffold2132.1/size88257/4